MSRRSPSRLTPIRAITGRRAWGQAAGQAGGRRWARAAAAGRAAGAPHLQLCSCACRVHTARIAARLGGGRADARCQGGQRSSTIKRGVLQCIRLAQQAHQHCISDQPAGAWQANNRFRAQTWRHGRSRVQQNAWRRPCRLPPPLRCSSVPAPLRPTFHPPESERCWYCSTTSTADRMPLLLSSNPVSSPASWRCASACRAQGNGLQLGPALTPPAQLQVRPRGCITRVSPAGPCCTCLQARRRRQLCSSPLHQLKHAAHRRLRGAAGGRLRELLGKARRQCGARP